MTPIKSRKPQAMEPKTKSTNALQWHTEALLCVLLLLVRYAVGLSSYSGAGVAPTFGDFEAQRHWMEITTQLPLSEWYFNSTLNDETHWRLDYPPLTAYVSYAFGLVAEAVNPDMVQLKTSWGYETPLGKTFMRMTVIACDVMLLIPVVFALAKTLYRSGDWTKRAMFSALVLLQPSLLLIDHGHFQYNNVSLGFAALAAVLILKDHEFLGSISYCLALNFKQMTLYYAPAFGIFLLARCLYQPNAILHLAKLALAVIATFVVLWAPFCLAPREDGECLASLAQVVHRIFPVARGLFEDKVANFWCIADLFLKIRRNVSPTMQMRLCTIATASGFSVSVIDLLRRRPTKLRFLLALTNCSLSFFLFSFHVHEKSILLPLLPVSMLFAYNSLVAGWFSVISTFSMFFLLKKDGLLVPYCVLQCCYLCLAVLPFLYKKSDLHVAEAAGGALGFRADGTPTNLLRALVVLSIAGMALSHLAQATVSLPAHLPHIHDYVFAGYSCGHFLVMLAYCTYWQWTVVEAEEVPQTTTKLLQVVRSISGQKALSFTI